MSSLIVTNVFFLKILFSVLVVTLKLCYVYDSGEKASCVSTAKLYMSFILQKPQVNKTKHVLYHSKGHIINVM